MKNVSRALAVFFANEKLAVFLLFFSSLFAIFWSGLVGGKMFARIFTTTLHYPVFEIFAQDISSGRMLLWAEHISGFPIVLSQFGLLHPLNFIFYFFDSITAYNWLIFINFLFAGFFTYIFLRNFGISGVGSAAAGFVYIFSHLLVVWGSVNVFNSSYPLLPLIFYSLLKISRGHLRYFFPGFFAFVAGWLGAFLEEIFYIGVLGFLFALLLDILNYRIVPDAGKLRDKNFKTLAFLILMIALSVIAASPWLLPAVNLTNLSLRSAGVAIEASKAGHSFFRAGDALKFFYPYFTPPDFFNRFANFFSEIPVYFGVMPLLFTAVYFLKIASSFYYRLMKNGGSCSVDESGREQKRIIQFFTIVGLITFLTQVEQTRFFEIIHALPVFNFFRGAWKWLFFSNFSFAVLVGYAIDNIPNVKKLKIFLKILKTLVFIVLTFSVLVNIVFLAFYSKILSFAYAYFDRNIYQSTAKLSLDFYHQRIKGTLDQIVSTFSFTDYHFLVSTIFILASFAAFYLYAKEKISLHHFRKLALGIIVLNFVFVWRGYYKYLPSQALKEPPPAANFLLKGGVNEQKDPYRIFRPFFDYYHSLPEFREGKDSIALDIETMKPNINLFYGIASASGDDNLVSRRYADFTDALNSLEIREDILVSEGFGVFLNVPDIQNRARIYSSTKARKLLGMMNVKYLLFPMEIKSVSPAGRQWKKVFETTVTNHNIPIYIYENPEVLPRVYFAKNIETISSSVRDDQILTQLLKIQDFKEQTLIECLIEDTLCSNSKLEFLISKQIPNPKSQIPTSDSIEIQELRPGYLRLKTNTKTPRWLVYSESNLPTWEASYRNLQSPTSNPQPLKIYTANYIYQAVFVPEGENEVVFEYPGLFRQMRYAVRDSVF